jgi:hypothetical protein
MDGYAGGAAGQAVVPDNSNNIYYQVFTGKWILTGREYII